MWVSSEMTTLVWVFGPVLTAERAEDLLLAGIRLLPPRLQNLLHGVQQAEDLGDVAEHGHLYQTGIWDQCGNQSKVHSVHQNKIIDIKTLQCYNS